ncbi:DUF6452 family protein [uncultured Winogradskyella sp.]|uniref:DUF6452 family protein n=1 Tax=uncultured Winogradskyella sp. TaxID=395353 RepID=UPI002618B812|nr:DUF6452 family protein [uncultured Winogradskyella sp.]
MRKLKFFILFIAIVLINCERDDICAESTLTTSRLSIEFYDATSPDDLKSVPRLTIYGDSPNISIPDDEDSSGAILIDPFETGRVYNANLSSAELPLIIANENEETTTRFILEKDTNLRLDTDNTTESNIDILEITYTTEFIYVSRACGYKSVFNGLGVIVENDTDNWISNIEVLETTIENENTVHVRIFH